MTKLRIETGGLPGETAAALSNSSFPNLTELTIYFGDPQYGASASLADLDGLLSGAKLPSLTHLGLANSEFQAEIAAALASSPILARLRSVDLSKGTMTDAGVAAILAAAPKFAHLDRLDLEHNFISEAAAAELRTAFPSVVLAALEQDRPREDRRRIHYYVSVGE